MSSFIKQPFFRLSKFTKHANSNISRASSLSILSKSKQQAYANINFDKNIKKNRNLTTTAAHYPSTVEGDNLVNLTNEFDAALFDMDGVIWRGQDSIDHSIDALNVLKLQGKRVSFVTNNSARTRAEVKLLLLHYIILH